MNNGPLIDTVNQGHEGHDAYQWLQNGSQTYMTFLHTLRRKNPFRKPDTGAAELDAPAPYLWPFFVKRNHLGELVTNAEWLARGPDNQPGSTRDQRQQHAGNVANPAADGIHGNDGPLTNDVISDAGQASTIVPPSSDATGRTAQARQAAASGRATRPGTPSYQPQADAAGRVHVKHSQGGAATVVRRRGPSAGDPVSTGRHVRHSSPGRPLTVAHKAAVNLARMGARMGARQVLTAAAVAVV